MIKANAVSANEIRSLNSWARVSASRGKALTLMSKVLTQCDINTMTNYGTSWLTITSEIALMAYESETMRRLAAYNFNKILMLCSQIPEIARDISTDYINAIFKQLLSSNLPESLPCLKCMKAILKYLPAPCGEFKGKLVKFLIPRMLSDITLVQGNAIRCWCYIPIVGGGGTNRKDHVAQWERQLNEVLNALEYVTSRFVDDLFSIHAKDEVDPALKSISLPFPSIKRIEPEQSKALLQRYTILCKCMNEMLRCKNFNAPVKIPFEKILSVVQSCCSVLPKHFGFTTEGRSRANHLIYFHRCSLEMLKSLMQSCSNYLIQHVSAINRVLGNLLDIWKIPPPDIGTPDDCISIRTDVYNAAILWVQTCGWKSKFLSDEVHLVNILLSHWVDDVLNNQEIMKAGEKEVSKGGRRKRKKVQPEAKEKKQFDHKQNSNLRISALKVARLSVYSHGSGLSILVHKTLQETVIKIILDSIKKSTHAFNKYDCSRKELYHLLLALTVSPNPSWPPPLQFALNFFQRLSATEKNLSIRTFCTEANTTLSLIVRPRAPSLQRASIHYNDECVRNYKESSHPTLDALQSRDVVHDQVIRVDASTSTHDFRTSIDEQVDIIMSTRYSDEELEQSWSDESTHEEDVAFGEEEDTTSGKVEEEDMTSGKRENDEVSSKKEDEEISTSEVKDDDAISEKDDVVTSEDEYDDAVSQEEHLNKRKFDDGSNKETKRLKLDDSPSLHEDDACDDEDDACDDDHILEKNSKKIGDESLSIASMIADFVDAKADQSNRSDVST